MYAIRSYYVLIRARQLELLAALQGEEILAVHMGLHFTHLAYVDDGGAVDALQDGRVQLLFQLLHRHAHDERFSAGVHAHVIARCIDPLDVLLFHPGRASYNFV